jgi:hypothetical protein
MNQLVRHLAEGVMPKVDLVSVYFTVRDDKKRLASDLTQDKFVLPTRSFN